MNMLLWVTICTISSRRKEKGKGGHALLCKWYMFVLHGLRVMSFGDNLHLRKMWGLNV
jgi:hypothetical protein